MDKDTVAFFVIAIAVIMMCEVTQTMLLLFG